MEKLFEIIFQQDIPWYVVLIILPIITIVMKAFNHFQYFHHYWVMKERNKVDDLLEKQKVVSSVELRSLVQDTVDKYVFYKCTGISANKHLRKAIIDSNLKYQIDLFHFKRAIRFINLNDNKIEIKISTLDKVEKYFNIIFAILLSGYAVYIGYSLFKFSNDLNAGQVIVLLFITIVLVLFGIYMLTQNFPFRSAMMLKQKLSK